MRRSHCKACEAARVREYRRKNPEGARAKDRERYKKRRKRAVETARQWVENNPERRKEYRRKYHQENRERLLAEARVYRQQIDPEAKREYDRAWRDANREALREQRRAYREANREDFAARDKAYAERNREQLRVKAAERFQKRYYSDPEYRERCRLNDLRRKTRLVDAFVEDVDPAVVFVRDNGVCGICGEPVDPDSWHLDHIVPLARSGTHEYANVQVAHPRCNMSKGARLAT